MALKSIDGLPILDAKRPIVLKVTKSDIDKADRKEPDNCAVARACRRELSAKEVRVHLGRVYVKTTPSSWTRYMTPRYLRSEIIAYDRGGTFVPGDFTLSAPSPSKATGKAQGSLKGKDKKRGAGSKKRQKPHVVTDVRLSITRHAGDGL